MKGSPGMLGFECHCTTWVDVAGSWVACQISICKGWCSCLVFSSLFHFISFRFLLLPLPFFQPSGSVGALNTYSNPKNCRIMCCSPDMDPWPCLALRSLAAWTDWSQSVLVVKGFWSWTLRGSQISAKASQGKAALPCLYTVRIWSLAWISRRSWLAGSWCRASFRWSHKSQATSQNFLISSEVHCLLDLQVRMWDQNCSCSRRHDWGSQPSINQSQLMAFWSANNCEAYWEAIGVESSWYQVWRPDSMASARIGEVRCSRNQDFSSLRKACHLSTAARAGHRRMCNLSSVRNLHQGHWADAQNFQCCMFFPWTKWPEMNLLTHHWRCRGISDIAHWHDCQSIWAHISGKILQHCCQYLTTGNPLIWLRSADWRFLTTRWLLT